MKVICVSNAISSASGETLARLRASITIEDQITDLVIGKAYPVQAIEMRGGGLWFYIHSVDMSAFPYPYPSEFFSVSDGELSAGWFIATNETPQGWVIKRITFKEWVCDDHYYERLVDSDPLAMEAYERCKVTSG